MAIIQAFQRDNTNIVTATHVPDMLLDLVNPRAVGLTSDIRRQYSIKLQEVKFFHLQALLELYFYAFRNEAQLKFLDVLGGVNLLVSRTHELKNFFLFNVLEIFLHLNVTLLIRL